jgi:hypothetical protein
VNVLRLDAAHAARDSLLEQPCAATSASCELSVARCCQLQVRIYPAAPTQSRARWEKRRDRLTMFGRNLHPETGSTALVRKDSRFTTVSHGNGGDNGEPSPEPPA